MIPITRPGGPLLFVTVAAISTILGADAEPTPRSPGEALDLAAAEEAAKPRVTVTDAEERDRIEVVEAALRDRPGDETLRFELARLLVREAVDGDRTAAERCLEMLEGLDRRRPDDPLVLAYLGTARLLEAKRLRAFWRKGSVAKDGLRLLDRAVMLAPEDVEIRFLRGRSTYAIPFFFGRRDEAARDLAWAAARAPRAVSAGTMPPDMAAAAFFYHGVCLDERGDEVAAREAWASASRIAPDSHHAEAARAKLEAPE